jgi:hypothetical protein
VPVEVSLGAILAAVYITGLLWLVSELVSAPTTLDEG